VHTLAKHLHDFVDDVSDALRLVKGMAGEGTLLEWAGKSADFWPKLERAGNGMGGMSKWLT
jgi:hypothetical protein